MTILMETQGVIKIYIFYFQIEIFTENSLILRKRSVSQNAKRSLPFCCLYKVSSLVQIFYVVHVYKTCELKTRSKIGSLTTLWTRHLVLKYIIVYLLLIVSGKKTVCAVIRCNTGIHKRKLINKTMIFWSSNSVYNYNKTGIERLKGLNLPGKLTKGIHQK